MERILGLCWGRSTNKLIKSGQIMNVNASHTVDLTKGCKWQRNEDFEGGDVERVPFWEGSEAFLWKEEG